MRVAIHQPQYWPWPRYLHKIMSADIFVYLDTVQFNKNGMQNRNKIKSANGDIWLTIPVKQKLDQKIMDTAIVNQKIFKKHWRSIELSYASTPGYKMWKEELREILLGSQTDSLCEISINSTEWLLHKLNVKNRRIKASDIQSAALKDLEGSKKIASLCAILKADKYLTGTGSLEYLNTEDFNNCGINVYVQKWKRLVYKQAPGKTGFIPDLSTLDLLLNHPDRARYLIERAGSWELI